MVGHCYMATHTGCSFTFSINTDSTPLLATHRRGRQIDNRTFMWVLQLTSHSNNRHRHSYYIWDIDTKTFSTHPIDQFAIWSAEVFNRLTDNNDIQKSSKAISYVNHECWLTFEEKKSTQLKQFIHSNQLQEKRENNKPQTGWTNILVRNEITPA